MSTNNTSKHLTLSQMGLQSLYKDAIKSYFAAKFQCPTGWYGILKEMSQAQKTSLVRTWYDVLYLVFLK